MSNKLFLCRKIATFFRYKEFVSIPCTSVDSGICDSGSVDVVIIRAIVRQVISRIRTAMPVNTMTHNLERYKGRVALVTGASSGIGAEIVRAFATRGIRVAGCARSLEKLKVVGESLGEHAGLFLPIQCDLTLPEEVQALFEKVIKELGSIDVLVNNAGVAYNSSVLDGCEEEWRGMMELNVLSLCQCTNLAVKAMKKLNIQDGYIININSESGHMHPRSSKFHFYSATKHCVRALSETLRTELKSQLPLTRISSISPGVVETQFLAKMTGDPDARLPLFDKLRSLQPGDVVDLVLYLLSTPIHVQIHDILLRPTEQKY